MAASNPTPSGGQQQGKQPGIGDQPDGGGAPVAHSPGKPETVAAQNLTGQPSEHKEAEKPAHNGWLGPDGAIALLTAVLAVVTWRLVVQTRRLVDKTQGLLEDAKTTSNRQAEEMKASLKIAEKSADAATANAELAEIAYVTAHRPRLVLRHANLQVKQTETGYEPLSVSFTIANEGATPATITKLSTRVAVVAIETLPEVPEYLPGVSMREVVDAAAIHRSHTGTADDAGEFFLANSLAQESINPPMDVFFIGYIEYEDRLRRQRYTGFIRKYDFITGKLEPESNSNYEYRD